MRGEFDDLLAEHFIGIGFTQLRHYAPLDGRSMSFKIDYSGCMYARFINLYFSLWPDITQRLHYVFTIYSIKNPKKKIAGDIVVNSLSINQMIREKQHVLKRYRIDFHAPNSFDNLTNAIIEAENDFIYPLVLPDIPFK